MFLLTGARTLYRHLPKSVGLRRITLHKSSAVRVDKLYLLLCKFSVFRCNYSCYIVVESVKGCILSRQKRRLKKRFPYKIFLLCFYRWMCQLSWKRELSRSATTRLKSSSLWLYRHLPCGCSFLTLTPPINFIIIQNTKVSGVFFFFYTHYSLL